MKFLGFLITMSFLSMVYGQTGKDLVTYKGRLIDQSGDAIGGAYIRNFKGEKTAVSDSAGWFQIDMLKDDSLIVIALGYAVHKLLPKGKEFETITLESVQYQLRPVSVYDFRDWDYFKKEFVKEDIPAPKMNVDGLPSYQTHAPPVPLRSNYFSSPPTVSQRIMSPFSSFAYNLSGKEKEKRKTLQQMRTAEAQSVFLSTVVPDTVRKLVDIPEDLLSEFMIYCNTEITEKELSDELYYKQRIVSLYTTFRKKKAE